MSNDAICVSHFNEEDLKICGGFYPTKW